MVDRRDADFESRGVRCAGWLYEPDDVSEPPVVLMAHGFGGERTMRLPAYAERFADAGYAVFLFDYRTFGDSGGEPRQIVSGPRHVADWHAALAHVRSLDGVDGSRVALWGTSFSGGHVVVTAAEDGDVDAVLAHVPFSDGRRNALHLVRRGGRSYALAATKAILVDVARTLTRRDPHYVPIVADPDEFGVLNTPGAREGFEAIVGDDADWTNECAARILATIAMYRPITRAGDVDCPVFVVEAADDLIIPPATVDTLVAALDHVERVRVPTGHFGPYRGAHFERVVATQREFLDRHLQT